MDKLPTIAETWWAAGGFLAPFTPTGGNNDGKVRDSTGTVVADCMGFEGRADVIASLLNDAADCVERNRIDRSLAKTLAFIFDNTHGFLDCDGWIEELKIFPPVMDDWRLERSIPTPLDLSWIWHCIKDRQDIPIVCVQYFKTMANRPAENVTKFADKMLPAKTVWEYMKVD